MAGNGDLPVASGDAHARVFERFGWVRQQARKRNHHIILRKPGHPMNVSIPNHREVKRALLGRLLRDVGISIEEYVAAWGGRRRG